MSTAEKRDGDEFSTHTTLPFMISSDNGEGEESSHSRFCFYNFLWESTSRISHF